MVGRASILCTLKTVVNEIFIRDSTDSCKNFVGNDESQLYPFSMCQAMPTGLYTSWELDSDSGNFKPRQNKTRSFENMVMSYFQTAKPQCKLESFYTTGTEKKMLHTVLMAFLGTATLCFKLWFDYMMLAHFKKLVFHSLRNKIRKALKRDS